MALDTAAKRLSVINIALPWRGLAVLADGDVGARDRQALLFLAAAIPFGPPGIDPTTPVTLQVSGFDLLFEIGDFI